ncbi:hypothetical protein [Myxococcus qinghaiensis]|uniref:hypothetical protein n=1 Tax=Myxococcus qinghaiensis TaxID=2906758 RepID=UPI0020A731E5|nr:hypothetical protein [Myxococcus qinghaiensis]MCP3166046.1 hypothetical protein [Myxococcus qinghaiensis]
MRKSVRPTWPEIYPTRKEYVVGEASFYRGLRLLRGLTRARREEHIQAILPVILELAALWDSSHLSRDFSREELEKAVR